MLAADDHGKTKDKLPERPRGPHPYPTAVNRLPLLAAAFVAAVALVLTGCGYEQGPAGRVVDKDSTYQSSTKTRSYELTVRKPDGSEHEFPVGISDYKACYLGSAYPKCTAVR